MNVKFVRQDAATFSFLTGIACNLGNNSLTLHAYSRAGAGERRKESDRARVFLKCFAFRRGHSAENHIFSSTTPVAGAARAYGVSAYGMSVSALFKGNCAKDSKTPPQVLRHNGDCDCVCACTFAGGAVLAVARAISKNNSSSCLFRQLRPGRLRTVHKDYARAHAV